jgi:HSP20 family protein
VYPPPFTPKRLCKSDAGHYTVYTTHKSKQFNEQSGLVLPQFRQIVMTGINLCDQNVMPACKALSNAEQGIFYPEVRSVSIARWEPFSELRRMREDMDRLFGNLLPTPMMAMPEVMGPAIDVFEKENNVVVKAELPGLNKDDIEITATDDSISIRGEFKQEEQTQEKGYLRRERRVGRFFRTIPMPTAIKPDEVKASFNNGILEIAAPMAEEKAKEKKVTIET